MPHPELGTVRFIGYGCYLCGFVDTTMGSDGKTPLLRRNNACQNCGSFENREKDICAHTGNSHQDEDGDWWLSNKRYKQHAS